MILLVEHDCGIDGWDASSKIVAVFDDDAAAIEALTQAGYTHYQNFAYYHHDPRYWGGMNTISYSLRNMSFHNEYTFPYGPK